MGAVFRKELKLYMSGMFGYFVIALLLLFTGIFVALFQLVSGYTDLSFTLSAMQWVLIVLIPLLSMRSIAEERHQKTDLLLFSLPLRMRDVVLGKFFAMATVFVIPTAITAIYPIILSSMGAFSLANSYTALLGYCLMGLAMIALCTFLSSLFENQIVSVVVCIAALLLLYFANVASMLLPDSAILSLLLLVLLELVAALLLWASTKNMRLTLLVAAILIIPTAILFAIKSEWFVALIPNLLHAVDLFGRFGGFTYGHIDLPATLTYLSYTVFFLCATVGVMEKRRFA